MNGFFRPQAQNLETVRKWNIFRSPERSKYSAYFFRPVAYSKFRNSVGTEVLFTDHCTVTYIYIYNFACTVHIHEQQTEKLLWTPAETRGFSDKQLT
jgi:hypothetical protein